MADDWRNSDLLIGRLRDLAVRCVGDKDANTCQEAVDKLGQLHREAAKLRDEQLSALVADDVKRIDEAPIES